MIGVDIISIARIKNMKQKEAFVMRVLTPTECETYDSFNDQKRKDQWLAGRFAAKEAIIKALLEDVNSYHDLTIDQIDKKTICQYQGKTIFVSIAHEDDYAIAIAMISL